MLRSLLLFVSLAVISPSAFAKAGDIAAGDSISAQCNDMRKDFIRDQLYIQGRPYVLSTEVNAFFDRCLKILGAIQVSNIKYSTEDRQQLQEIIADTTVEI